MKSYNFCLNTSVEIYSLFEDCEYMSIATRKEREYKEREQLILRTAFNMLHSEGYIGFTIDKLAKKIEYAKGTVYKHFSCKEDILLKIMIDGFSQRVKFISRSFSLELPERALFIACTVGSRLYNQLNPNLHRLVNIAAVESIWNKVGQELRESHNAMIKRVFTSFDELIQNAVNNGKLELGEHQSSDIYYTILSIVISYDALGRDMGKSGVHSNFFKCLGNMSLIENSQKAMSLNLNTYLDGLNWKPLSSEFDYYALEKEVAETVYADLTEMVKRGESFDYVSTDEL